ISVVVALMELFPPSAITMDKIAFALISLTIGGFFMFNVVWSFRTGELRALFAQSQKKPAKNEAEEKSESAPSKSA
ncbi:MAG TPA: hypothetical protein VFM21_08060, partial [Terriglobia bacterium]|nr:hypothetical protein [Terriglobia bacterium]